jgi:cell division protein FtsW
MLNLQIIKSKSKEPGETQDSSFSPSLFMVALILGFILFGLTMLYSTSSGIGKGYSYFIKQSMWVGVGLIPATVIYFSGYRKLAEYSKLFLILAILALMSTLFFPEVNGARRWIKLPGMSIQPSEFAKLALILFLSQFLAKKQRFLNSFRSVLPGLIWVGIVLFFILFGIKDNFKPRLEDLGTTVLLAATVWFMFFAAGMRIKWLLLPPAVVIPLLSTYIYFFDRPRLNRLLSFLDPEAVNEESGYQLWNSLLALGSGGWTGMGFTESRMKAMYLPEAHTDFILSIVGEELGFLCMFFVLAGYAAITVFGIWISVRTENKSKMLLGLGATSLITLQAIINLGVVSGALPTKGMPAPFISYGGSNMVMAMCCIALLLCIDKERKMTSDNPELNG